MSYFYYTIISFDANKNNNIIKEHSCTATDLVITSRVHEITASLSSGTLILKMLIVLETKRRGLALNDAVITGRLASRP